MRTGAASTAIRRVVDRAAGGARAAAARSRAPPETRPEDLGVRRPVRGAVVEQHDALGQRHRPRRPRDHDGRRRAPRTAAARRSSSPTWPPATTRAPRRPRISATSARCPATAARSAAARPRRRRAVPRTTRAEVPLVDEPDDALGVGAARRGAPRQGGVGRATSCSARSARRADQVSSRCSASAAGARARRRRTPGRASSTSSQRAYRREVDAAAAEQRRRARRRRARAPASRR